MLRGTALLGAPTTTAFGIRFPSRRGRKRQVHIARYRVRDHAQFWGGLSCQQAWERVIERNETALPARAPEGRRASYLSTTCGFQALKWENIVGARAR